MAASEPKILVWDAPVRVFHWLLVLCFFGAFLSAESERWRLLHVSLGYTLGGLVAFRLVWGVLGTRYARFRSFVRGPQALVRYGQTLLSGHPERHVGHNPAGALAIVALLLCSVLIVASGWAIYNDVGPEVLADWHEGAAKAMLLLVGVHVAGVLVASWLHRENLVRAMVRGTKAGPAQDGIARARYGLALALVAAVLGFWWLQWQSAPSAPLTSTAAEAAQYGARAHDGDDDD